MNSRGCKTLTYFKRLINQQSFRAYFKTKTKHPDVSVQSFGVRCATRALGSDAVTYNLAVNHVDDILSNIGRMIGDPFKIARHG